MMRKHPERKVEFGEFNSQSKDALRQETQSLPIRVLRLRSDLCDPSTLLRVWFAASLRMLS
jgi:hypothetical protein